MIGETRHESARSFSVQSTVSRRDGDGSVAGICRNRGPHCRRSNTLRANWLIDHFAHGLQVAPVAMKAVVLAAGCATRLRPHTDDKPKTLLHVGGVPILRRTITNLLRCGFDQFVVGTGYLEGMVRDSVASWFPGLDVEFVSNPDYRTTNNAYSLLLMREQV